MGLDRRGDMVKLGRCSDVDRAGKTLSCSYALRSVERGLKFDYDRLFAARLPSPARRTPTWLSHTWPSLS